MTLSKIRIVESPDGNWSVTIDGQEFAPRIAAGSLTLDIGQPHAVSKVGLHLIANVEAEFTGVIVMTDADREMLMGLGWKPPTDEA